MERVLLRADPSDRRLLLATHNKRINGDAAVTGYCFEGRRCSASCTGSPTPHADGGSGPLFAALIVASVVGGLSTLFGP